VRSEGIRSLQGSGAAAIGPALERLILVCLFVYIVALPFRRLLIVERNGFIVLCVLFGLWCAIHRTHFFQRTPINLPLAVFVGWIGLSIPFATFPAYSAHEFGKLLQQILLFYAVLYFFGVEPYRRRLLWAMIVASMIVSAYGINEFFAMAGVVPALKHVTELESFTSGEVWLTTYLVMTIPVCLAFVLFEQRPLERGAYTAATVLGVLCLLFTNSRAGLLALLAEVGLMIAILRRKTLVLGVAVFCVLIIAVEAVVIHYNVLVLPGTTIAVRGLRTKSFLHRFEIWQFATKQLMEHPFLGVGYGKDNFRLMYAAPGETDPGKHAPVLTAGTHNIFLDLALGAGIPAAAAFIWLLWRILMTALRNFRNSSFVVPKAVTLGVAAGVVGMAVRLSFDQMLIGTLAIQFWIWIGLCVSMHPTESDQTTSIPNR
jgi:O-antigen ligase